ncbi:MAG: HAD-IIA family hydrolase [Blautia sp.]|nr:HAD-IIA family hydrolase [Blautia sp.]MCM1200748.1 HAD-IIA family hydrolase [Bacteroides fragilis]
MQKKIPVINQDPEQILRDVRCFALDMDGTVYLGEKWIDGARDFLGKIEESGRGYVFVTNNSSRNAAAYVDKLHRMGWEIGPEKVVTSGQAAVFYLKKHFAGKKVFLLGNSLLRAEFEQAGIVLEERTPDVVVVGFDTSLDYQKMCRVCDHVRDGLPYLATHPDYNCPTETGFIPDAGAIQAFIHASAFRYPDRIIGKPNGDIIDYLTVRAGVEKERIAMVGDRLYTDIAAGRNNGLKSILVLSGEASFEDAADSDVTPHLIFESVRDMIPLL